PPFHSCDLSILTTKRVPGDVGFILMSAMILSSALRLRFEVDRLTGGEAHVGLLPVLRATERLAEPAHLAGLVHDLHARHLDVEHQLDGGADLRLGRIAAHAKRVLVMVLHDERRLLGDVRRQQDVHQLFLAHCRRSSSSFTAPTVISTLSWVASATGLSAAAGSTSTCGRLRAARNSFSSIASTTISTLASDRFFSSL